VGVEDTLKGVTKLVFKSLSARYGTDAASGPAGRAAAVPPAPGNARAAGAPAPPRAATPPPAASTPEELLEELDLSPATDPGGFGNGPELMLEDDDTPPPSPVPPPPVRPDARSTLVSSRLEADELRRRMSPSPELDVDLEHLDQDEEVIEDIALDPDPLAALSPEQTAPPVPRMVPPPPRASAPGARAPEPLARGGPPPAPVPITVDVAPGQQQVDVPIDIRLPRAGGELRLNLRLVIRTPS
jgi:hypothetical protein